VTCPTDNAVELGGGMEQVDCRRRVVHDVFLGTFLLGV
jgi:hypothetical protein